MPRSSRDRWNFLWANLHLLFSLSHFPFTTAWAGENHLAPTPTAVYGFALLMAANAYYILQRTIARATQHAVFPGARGEFALHFEFAGSRHGGRPQGLVGVGNLPRQCASTAGRAGTQTVAMMAITQFNLGKTFQIQLA